MVYALLISFLTIKIKNNFLNKLALFIPQEEIFEKLNISL